MHDKQFEEEEYGVKASDSQETTTKRIWVNGCFDVLHVGHVELLKHAKSLGDELIVGIDSDSRVKKMKGDKRPINTMVDRIRMLESIKYVDQVVVFGTDEELSNLIEIFNIETMVVGTEYKDKEVIGSENATNVEFFDKVEEHSTTNILKRRNS